MARGPGDASRARMRARVVVVRRRVAGGGSRHAPRDLVQARAVERAIRPPCEGFGLGTIADERNGFQFSVASRLGRVNNCGLFLDTARGKQPWSMIRRVGPRWSHFVPPLPGSLNGQLRSGPPAIIASNIVGFPLPGHSELVCVCIGTEGFAVFRVSGGIGG